MWICKNCDTKNEDKDQYCACCGEKRSYDTAAKSTSSPGTGSSYTAGSDLDSGSGIGYTYKPSTGSSSTSGTSTAYRTGAGSTTPSSITTTAKPARKTNWGKRILISVVASLILSFAYDAIENSGSRKNSSSSSTSSTVASTARPTTKPTVTPRPTSTAITVKPVITSIKLDSLNQPYLIWTALSNAKQYHVYYSASQSGTYTDIGIVTGTETTITGSVPGETEYYKIRAEMKDGTWSEYSNAVNIRIPATSSSSSPSSSTQSSNVDSYFVVGKMTNATFNKLMNKMRVNLDLKYHSIPTPTQNGASYNNGAEYERYSMLRYDSANEYESIGYIYNNQGKALYIIRSWAGYHKDGPRILLDVYYETDGTYLGYQSRDLTNNLSNSSSRSPYYMPGQGTHKLE